MNRPNPGNDTTLLLQAATFAADKRRHQRRKDAAASPSSTPAKQLKIADKIANVRDILADPPIDWSLTRKLEYLDWADQVIQGCRGINAALDACWDVTIADARRTLEAEH